TYQWRKGGNNLSDAGSISGTTTTSLVITGVTTSDAGSYDVVVTNAAGSTPSSAATLTVNQLPQTITFAALADRAYTSTPFSLSASAGSGLPVTFSILSGPALLSGSSLTLTGTGTVTVRAAQSGDATYSAAVNVDRSFVVSQATAIVTLGDLGATYSGAPHSATATTSPAGLAVSFTYDGSATAPTDAGSYAVVGTINDALYQGTASGTLTIGRAAATVTLGSLAHTYDGTAKSATATTNPAGLTVGFTYDGGGIVPTNAGSYAIVGTISHANHQGSAGGTLVIAKADQTISFTGPANQTYHATPITLSATASSGLTVSFAAMAGPASVTGSSLTLTGAGLVTVRASQAGDANRNAAPDVDQSFTVAGTFASWAQSRFTGSELLDANRSGPNAVYGLDGLPNLVKYALGLEPKQNVTTGLPEVSVVGSDWVYTYTRPASVTDVAIAVEVSTNLSTWTSTGVTHEFVSTSGGTETWRATYPLASASNAFFRLKVTRP
ncbi:MAG: MBG domain-containing protein, partial [Candidatus Didemnitutus sp.]|nr:MBG domain-containing protein [Candidatus Didemnitutus sp.]